MKKYHMEKAEREITDPSLISKILKNGKYTTIALCNNNKPYIITLSFGYEEAKKCLYFHTAKKGLKLKFLKNNPHVCGTVVLDLGYKPNECSHSYRSVVFWGILTIVENLEEKKHAMNILFTHLEENPARLKSRFLTTDAAYLKVCIMRLKIQHITGKASS